MKAIYVKPSLKFKEIDVEESMLTDSRNFKKTLTGYQGTVGTSATTTTEVESTSALSKQGSFPGDQWDDEE